MFSIHVASWPQTRHATVGVGGTHTLWAGAALVQVWCNSLQLAWAPVVAGGGCCSVVYFDACVRLRC
jgi:hypothetical protein